MSGALDFQNNRSKQNSSNIAQQFAQNTSNEGSQQTSNQSSQMGQSVYQNDALNKLYELAFQTFGNNQNVANQGRDAAIANAKNVVNSATPAWQQQLAGGAFAGLGTGNTLMSSLNNSLNSPTNTQAIYQQIMGGPGNNYADAMKAAYIGDANRVADNMMRTLDARATGSGMSGGGRHGIAQAQGMYDINSNLQHNLAQVGYNTFDKDLANKLQIANQADQGTLARQQMLADLLTQQNNASVGALNFGEGMQNLGLGTIAPSSASWSNLNGLLSAIGAPIVLNQGSSNSSSQGTSFGNSQGTNNGISIGSSSGKSKGSKFAPSIGL